MRTLGERLLLAFFRRFVEPGCPGSGLDAASETLFTENAANLVRAVSTAHSSPALLDDMRSDGLLHGERPLVLLRRHVESEEILRSRCNIAREWDAHCAPSDVTVNAAAFKRGDSVVWGPETVRDESQKPGGISALAIVTARTRLRGLVVVGSDHDEALQFPRTGADSEAVDRWLHDSSIPAEFPENSDDSEAVFLEAMEDVLQKSDNAFDVSSLLASVAAQNGAIVNSDEMWRRLVDGDSFRTWTKRHAGVHRMEAKVDTVVELGRDFSADSGRWGPWTLRDLVLNRAPEE